MSDGDQRWQPALILYRIVQKGGDSLILVASRLKHQSAHTHQVVNEGNGDALRSLRVVQSGGELQRGALMLP
jgi:hypothetical protein